MDKVFRLLRKASTPFQISLVQNAHPGTQKMKKGFNQTYRPSDTTLGQEHISPMTKKVGSIYCQTSKIMEPQSTLGWETKLQEKCQNLKLLGQDHTCLQVSSDICTCTSLQLETWKPVP